MALPDGFQHTFYENGIPPEVGRFLEKRYQSPFSVPEYFETVRGMRSLNAVDITHGESGLRHVMAYAVSGREITVANELVAIDQDYLHYFAAAVFDRYPAVTTVNFNCLKGQPADIHYPWRCWKTSHDIAIQLPRSFDAYHAKLGMRTRKHIKYYINRLRRDYGDFTFQVTGTHEIDPSVIGRIMEMNRLRMKGKSIRSGYDRAYGAKIEEFCRHYGLISTVSIQGKVVAGAICYEVGNEAYLEAISHDPAYDRCNVGQVCLYLTINHMIEKGRDAFHMLWGENEYKYRFLGVKQELYFISLYRSYRHKLFAAPKAAKHACSQAVRQLEYMTRKYIINRCRR